MCRCGCRQAMLTGVVNALSAKIHDVRKRAETMIGTRIGGRVHTRDKGR